MENEKQETFNDEDNELEKYKTSYYKWGSYCFKAGFIACALFFLIFIRNLIR